MGVSIENGGEVGEGGEQDQLLHLVVRTMFHSFSILKVLRV